VTVDVHKDVPFYSPDSFFSFVPPHQKEFFLWEEFFLRIFSSFVRFGDGRVCTQYKVFPNATIISVLVILIILSVYHNQFFFLLSFFSATSAKTTTSFFSSSLSS